MNAFFLAGSRGAIKTAMWKAMKPLCTFFFRFLETVEDLMVHVIPGILNVIFLSAVVIRIRCWLPFGPGILRASRRLQMNSL